MSRDQKDIERAIIKGINGIISQVTGVTEKILKGISGYIKSIKPVLEVSTDGMKLVLQASEFQSSPENICEALQILNAILEKKNQKAVLLIDEFQEVERVAHNSGIEGAIRHVAQETEHFSFIFSGSKRNLLKSMFNDRNKPLYRLCDEIILERIGEEDYHKFVDKFSKKKWRKSFGEENFQAIVECTERHPYYFNSLLRSVFLQKEFPNQQGIKDLWRILSERKHNDLLSETKDLTGAHRKLLVAIANGKNQKFTSQEFLGEIKVAGSTVTRAIDELVEEDFIEKVADRYQIVDPLLKTILLKIG